jgi:hypothetical protein
LGVAEFRTAWFPMTLLEVRRRPAASGGICRQRTGLRKVQSCAIRRPADHAGFAISRTTEDLHLPISGILGVALDKGGVPEPRRRRVTQMPAAGRFASRFT